MPRAKQRTPELRDRLLDVAIATLSEEGIARFTTRRVAERAGTSVPAVYELFDDKAGLVRAMFFEGFRLLGGELAKVPVTDGSRRGSGAAGAGVPIVLPGVSAAGAGDVLAAVHGFRAWARRAGGGGVGAGGVRRPDPAVHRCGSALGGPHRHGACIARSGTGFGGAGGRSGGSARRGRLIERRWKLGVTSLLRACDSRRIDVLRIFPRRDKLSRPEIEAIAPRAARRQHI